MASGRIGAILAIACILAAPLHGQSYLGYVEADYVRPAPVMAGRLVRLMVDRGGKVEVGTPIGQLDDTLEQAELAEARARFDQAAAQRADLEAARRPREIQVVEAQLRQAEAMLVLSRAQVKRLRALADSGVASRDALDQAVMAVTRDEAHVREMTEQLALSRQRTGRDQAVEAARAAEASADAAVRQAEWRLAERKIVAATAGAVIDVIYRPGEIVPAGAALVLIQSPDLTRARFYVPQRDLSKLALGQMVMVACDGCAAPISARISYIAPQAEFTPPVIYSDGARDKLVFLVEARGVAAALPIQPGQPIRVTPAGDKP